MIGVSAELLDRIADVIGPDHVRRSNQVAAMDPGVEPRNLGAGLVARPADADETAAVLALCAGAGVSVVAHGGRTGLAAGAASSPGQIVLSSERMTGIEIDPEERVAVVGAGVTLQALQEAAAEHGLAPGIDIAARGSATIGGMISTNAGGMEAFRHGMMRQRLLGLTAALADGSVIRDRSRVTKANEGYDLKQIFCGAEGTIGAVTEAVIRLVKKDRPQTTILAAADSAAGALTAMRAFEDAGGLLLAEIMWRLYVDRATRAMDLGHVVAFSDAPIYVIYELATPTDEALDMLGALVESGALTDAVVAQNQGQRADIWRIREDSQAVRHELGCAAFFDVSAPLGRLDAYVSELRERLRALDPSLRLSSMGHLADGNLHLTVDRDAPLEDIEAISIAVESGLKDVGGAVSAEHGIGEAKRGALARNASGGALDAMRALKAAFDPLGTMNPGKVLPARRDGS